MEVIPARVEEKPLCGAYPIVVIHFSINYLSNNFSMVATTPPGLLEAHGICGTRFLRYSRWPRRLSSPNTVTTLLADSQSNLAVSTGFSYV